MKKGILYEEKNNNLPSENRRTPGHLIVTVTFAILTLISIVAALMICNPALYVLTLLLVVLLIPYIMHYYTLENEVQKMYGQYDRILEHMREENQGLR